ncbi:LLM class flavin-dependent oxidoreductase [Mumia sp. zg.B21]|uniref:LLM class flavin-dependent oxidoreductase n=1 Tax=Mumia sp. zg.B21 TaxID=2855447 RepID=UPI001C6DE605|nr:LLM class flavin-dependent oxidoreductase [Mumia sp. zg.B21]MBW9209293.1 LLM class flavin-dependent oxidoreductase [Mumia sp. zg.B21]
MPLELSVLDLVPVRTDQSTGDALAATVALAQAADNLGYTRYWLAEHHNMPAVAASSPPVLIAHVAAQTERIRVGSGGVMLPNHAPLAVAEQFALLEAAHPGRIDLGIGRAPGSDQVTSWMLRGAAGRDNTDIEQFPQYLDDVMALMDSQVGVRVPLQGRQYLLKATPAATSVPRQWLLGSSMYSAHLAAAKGLPYVFAHHFSGKGTAEALATYRAEFRPSERTPEPTTFLTVNAVVAETYDEAVALALPNLQSMARLMTGAPLAALDLVEDAEKSPLTPTQEAMVQDGLARNIVGDPEQAAQRLQALAAEFEVDEVMVHPVASARQGADPRRSVPRERTLELLAEALG